MEFEASELLTKVLLITLLWLIFRKSKKGSPFFKPLIHWPVDDRKHSHKVVPVRISTDHMFAIALYIPVLLISTAELVTTKDYEFRYSVRYTIGFLLAGIGTSLIKFAVSRPRPNAIAYESAAEKSEGRLHISRQSFLSAHAFGGVYASTFMSLFVMQQQHLLPSLLHYIIVAAIFVSGLIPGLMQALDHWHHETDVLAGYVFGLTTAMLSFCYA